MSGRATVQRRANILRRLRRPHSSATYAGRARCWRAPQKQKKRAREPPDEEAA
eukprot:CAMPEP_0176258286 /NCGR_PEP_ID=MMETSP0121_2-20121125/38480_1 /TAXON_ID=160619 /ORGANISM="Kryptoperidinium foliaceum, Strain CCMP 1326" /LENGTH=52 /DNA_ID=CAMNT_0017598143 /DNA_START=275 /DNA_END=433 /DNA_ORIENTATION=-